jgi:hypothetical protein
MNTETCNICQKPTGVRGAGPTRLGVQDNGNGSLTLSVSHSSCADAAESDPIEDMHDWEIAALESDGIDC